MRFRGPQALPDKDGRRLFGHVVCFSMSALAEMRFVDRPAGDGDIDELSLAEARAQLCPTGLFASLA